MNPVSTLVDSNVLLDILTDDAGWFEWSSTALIRAADLGPVIINALVVAEVAHHFESFEELADALSPKDFRLEEIPSEAAFLAGRAHVAYRRRGGERLRTFPDFLIGAHAAVSGHALLTRDARRYQTYFPTVQVVAPNR